MKLVLIISIISFLTSIFSKFNYLTKLEICLAFSKKSSSGLDPFYLDYDKFASLNRKFTPKNFNDLSKVFLKGEFLFCFEKAKNLKEDDQLVEKIENKTIQNIENKTIQKIEKLNIDNKNISGFLANLDTGFLHKLETTPGFENFPFYLKSLILEKIVMYKTTLNIIVDFLYIFCSSIAENQGNKMNSFNSKIHFRINFFPFDFGNPLFYNMFHTLYYVRFVAKSKKKLKEFLLILIFSSWIA